jgi:hypothetical protein
MLPVTCFLLTQNRETERRGRRREDDARESKKEI